MSIRERNTATGQVIGVATESALIDGLGSKLDVSAYEQPGLELITAQSLSAVSSIQINNCFTSTYQNYKIIVRLTTGTAASANIKFSAGGTPDSTSNYSRHGAILRATYASIAQTGQTDFTFATLRTLPSLYVLEISGPQQAANTVYTVYGIDTNTEIYAFGGTHAVASSFDGCTIASAVAMTGTIRIYGYRN